MRKILIIFISFIVLVIIAAGGYFLFDKFSGKIFSGGNNWYAVYLNNKDVYFGRISSITPETIFLKDVYYLEVYNPQLEQTSASKNFQLQSAPQQIYNLIHRGSDINSFLTDHNLFIDRRAVLFWEKLEFDSQILKLIEKAKEVRN